MTKKGHRNDERDEILRLEQIRQDNFRDYIDQWLADGNPIPSFARELAQRKLTVPEEHARQLRLAYESVARDALERIDKLSVLGRKEG